MARSASSLSSQDRVDNFYQHGPNYDYTISGAQVGIDLYQSDEGQGSSVVAGGYVGLTRISSEVQAVYGGHAGTSTMYGYSIGGYWTHNRPSGVYIDGVLQYTHYGQIRTQADQGQEMNTSGNGLAASLEVGYPIPLGDPINGLSIEPQAQVVYQHLNIKDSSDTYGQMHFGSSNTGTGRIGMRLNKAWPRDSGQILNTWMHANVWSQFGSRPVTAFSNANGDYPVALQSGLGGTWGQIGVGTSGDLSANTSATVLLDYNRNLGGNRGHSTGARMQFRLKW